jgi:hypothetical protein
MRLGEAVLIGAAFVLARPASADTVTGSVQQLTTGLPFQTALTFYVAATHETIANVVSDVNGDFTINDPVHAGQPRCVAAVPRGGYDFDPPVLCATNFGGGGVRIQVEQVAGQIKVFGGAHGYVNPNLGERASIVVTPSSAGTATVTIVTLRGQRVVTLQQGVTPGGQNEIFWNCHDGNGGVVASGIYLAHIVAPGINVKEKIAVVKK